MQINKYNKLAPELYSLAQYDVEEIVKNLPVICDDTDILWDMLLETFGEECFTPNIVRKFPAQFTADTKSQKEQLQKLQAEFDGKFAKFEAKITEDLARSSSELSIYKNESATLERLYQSVKTAN